MASVDALRAAVVANPQAAGNSAVTSLNLRCSVHGLSLLILDGMLESEDVNTLAQAVTSGTIS